AHGLDHRAPGDDHHEREDADGDHHLDEGEASVARPFHRPGPAVVGAVGAGLFPVVVPGVVAPLVAPPAAFAAAAAGLARSTALVAGKKQIPVIEPSSPPPFHSTVSVTLRMAFSRTGAMSGKYICTMPAPSAPDDDPPARLRSCCWFVSSGFWPIDYALAAF